MFDIHDVEEVLAELFLSDQVGRLAVVLSELTDGPDVDLLSTLRQTPELERLDHSLAQFSHSDTS